MRTNRSAKALAQGARMGVRITLMPSLGDTSSNGPENFASPVAHEVPGVPEPFPDPTFLAYWVTQAESGWAVTPARCTRRVESSTKNKT